MPLLSFVVSLGLLFPYIPANATTCTTSGDNITIAANCIFDAGTYTFTGTLTINSGVTVTAASNVGAGQVINIDVQGTIDANGTGYSGGSGPGVGPHVAGARRDGADHGNHAVPHDVQRRSSRRPLNGPDD